MCVCVCRQVYAKYDTNSDGKVQKAELAAGLRKSGMAQSFDIEAVITKIEAAADGNADDIVSMEEWLSWNDPIEDSAVEAIRKLQLLAAAEPEQQAA